MRTATPVNFTLDLNGRGGPRSSQVARALIDAIARGQVHDGDRLPSTRTLAATFGLARTAVVAAYEELTAAGFLVARPGGSTYVERGAAAFDRALAPLREFVLALQRDQRIDAADGAQRRDRRGSLGRLLFGDGKPAGSRALGRRRIGDPCGGVRSEDAHGEAL